MQKLAPFLLLLALLAAPAVAQKVFVDFDDTVDFSQYETFAFKNSPEDLRDTNELGHTRVQNAIRRQLIEGGGLQVQSDPDLWVTYHTAEKDKIRIDSTSLGYGYGSGWYGSGWRHGGYWGGYGGGYSTTVSNYTEGTLVIDIWDAKKDQMIWRGIATAVVPAKAAKAEKKLDKALAKMAKAYQKQQRKNAKRLGKA